LEELALPSRLSESNFTRQIPLLFIDSQGMRYQNAQKGYGLLTYARFYKNYCRDWKMKAAILTK